MRAHYAGLGFVEGPAGVWKLPQKGVCSPIKKSRQHKARRAVTVDALTEELGSTKLSGSRCRLIAASPIRGHTLADLRQVARAVASSHELASALAACSVAESRGSQSTVGYALEMDCNMAADQMMQGLAPGDWRDYMELRLATKHI